MQDPTPYIEDMSDHEDRKRRRLMGYAPSDLLGIRYIRLSAREVEKVKVFAARKNLSFASAVRKWFEGWMRVTGGDVYDPGTVLRVTKSIEQAKIWAASPAALVFDYRTGEQVAADGSRIAIERLQEPAND